MNICVLCGSNSNLSTCINPHVYGAFKLKSVPLRLTRPAWPHRRALTGKYDKKSCCGKLKYQDLPAFFKMPDSSISRRMCSTATGLMLSTATAIISGSYYKQETTKRGLPMVCRARETIDLSLRKLAETNKGKKGKRKKDTHKFNRQYRSFGCPFLELELIMDVLFCSFLISDIKLRVPPCQTPQQYPEGCAQRTLGRCCPQR